MLARLFTGTLIVLEAVLHPNLDGATSVQSQALRAEDAGTWIEKIPIAADVVLSRVEMIKRVEEICSELQGLRFMNFEILQYRKVVLLQSGQAN